MRHYCLIFHCFAHNITNNLFSVFFPDNPDTFFLLESLHIKIHLSSPWLILCTIKVWHGRWLVVVCCISAFSLAHRVIFSRFTLRILLLAKARLSSSWNHFVCENEIAPAVRPPWLQNFKNRYHRREALDELTLAKFKLPAANEAIDQLTTSKMEDWTMPFYKLELRNVPVHIDTSDLFDVRVKKNWVMDPLRAIETALLRYNQPFGREDQEGKPKLFETVVSTTANSAYCTTSGTYDKDQSSHDTVHKQAETGEFE